MTVTAERVEPWRTRPGWGISADLTPPEVVNERHVARLRRRLGLGLIVLLILVGAGYVLAVRHHGAAETALEEQQAETVRLQARAAEFRDITATQSTLVRLRTQIATLMTSDIDFDPLVAKLSSSLPPRMTITSESVSLSAAGAADAGAAPSEGVAEPETATTIGTVALAGKGRTLDDLAAYVERLQAIAGLTDVVPTSNTASGTGVNYTITLNLTSDLLSHRFDVSGATP